MGKFSLIICALVLNLSSYAQEKEVIKKSSYFGIRAGVNFFKGSTNINQSSDLGVGYQIGGLVNLPLGKSNFSFQPEISYLKINSKETEVENGFSNVQITRRREYSSNFLMLPLNFRYLIKDKVGIELGPSVGYRFLGTRTNTETYYEYSTGNTESYSYESKTSDSNNFAALLNFGLDYNITKKANIGFKYYFVFERIDEGENLMDNSLFLINLGYNFK